MWLQYGAGERKVEWDREPSGYATVRRLDAAPGVPARENCHLFGALTAQILHVGRLTIPVAEDYIGPLGRAAA